jgi:hypothetical protein
MSLYEGTNGIQSMDLLGRKMRVNNGAPYLAYKTELQKFFDTHKDHPSLGANVRELAVVFDRLDQMARELNDKMASDPLQWASSTYPALTAFSEVTMAWRLLDMAIVASDAMDSGKKNDFYFGKVLQATYFVDVTLPHTLATVEVCLREGREVVDIPLKGF